MSERMVTTIDNPFNPFTQFDDWYRFDSDHGYHTCEYLARIAKTSNDLSEEANSAEIDRAVDRIVEMNVNGMYKVIYDNG